MKELLEALKALERLGAEWKVRRASELYLRDTVECTALVQTNEGVVRGVIKVSHNDVWRVQAGVACYLNGHLKNDGTFKHMGHPASKTVKVFEYANTVLYKYSKGLFGLGAGFHPIGLVPTEHQYLTDFAGRLIAETDTVQKTGKDEAIAVAESRRQENEARARRALFG